MSGFNDFVSTELPKRPFTEADGQPGQMLVRSSNPQAARQLVWADVPTGGSAGSVPGAYPEPATAFNAGDPEFLFTDTGDVVMINVA